MTEKEILRRKIRDAKRRFTGAELDGLSLGIIRRLLSHPVIRRAGTILMYHSLPDEVNTHGAVDILAGSGKTVLLPKVVSDTGMDIHLYCGKCDLRMGAFGIMEPVGGLFTHYDDIEVAVVPGMAFDAEGNRLGRGKGYYDRFLANIPGVYKIGLCFDFQKIEKIPAGDYDVRMDEVIC